MSRQRKAFILTNKLRSIQKNVAADSLEQLIQQGRDIFSYQDEDEVYLVLEEDGTEVDDEEYFQTLPEFTVLMLLDNLKEIWAPTLGDFENEPRGTLSARKLAKALLEHIRASTLVKERKLMDKKRRKQRKIMDFAVMKGRKLKDKKLVKQRKIIDSTLVWEYMDKSLVKPRQLRDLAIVETRMLRDKSIVKQRMHRDLRVNKQRMLWDVKILKQRKLRDISLVKKKKLMDVAPVDKRNKRDLGILTNRMIRDKLLVKKRQINDDSLEGLRKFRDECRVRHRKHMDWRVVLQGKTIVSTIDFRQGLERLQRKITETNHQMCRRLIFDIIDNA